MPDRSLDFANRSESRYWWFQTKGRHYVPPVYAWLTDEEWRTLDSWYTETDARFPSTGECNVPAISLLHGLVMGSGIRRVVQLGHFVGYSTLLLGFMMRHMGVRTGVFSIDVDPDASDYTRRWVTRAGLDEQVRIHVGDSADPAAAAEARACLGGAPDLVFVDSSHAYAHTLAELDLWYGQLRPGGLLLLHDASAFAAQFDPRLEGGVTRALDEWLRRTGAPAIKLNGDAPPGVAGEALTYGDPCGLGLIQRPFA